MPRAKCNGVEIEYESRGEGEPLLLVMGIGGQLSDWPDGLLDAFESAGYHVVVFDNRDAGLSEKLHGATVSSVPQLIARGMAGLSVTAPYRLEDMADDMAELLDHLGLDDAHVMGMSLGGMVAQSFALRHPRRTRTLTSVMSSAGRRRNALGTPAALKALLRPPAQTVDDAIAGSVAFHEVCGSKAWPTDWDMVREVAARSYERSDDRTGFLRQLAAVVSSGSRYKALQKLEVPTAVVHGSIDPLVRPAAGRDTARAVPSATLRVVDGMGHDLPSAVWPILVEEIETVRQRAASSA